MNRFSLIVTATLSTLSLFASAEDRKIDTTASEKPHSSAIPDPYLRTPHHGWLKGDALTNLPEWQKQFGRTDLTTLEHALAGLYRALERSHRTLGARERALADATALEALLDFRRIRAAVSGEAAAMQDYSDALSLTGEDWAMIREGAALPEWKLQRQVGDLAIRRLTELDLREAALTQAVIGLAQARRAMAEEILRRHGDGFASGAATSSLEFEAAWNDIVGRARNAEEGILLAATPTAEFRSNGAVGRTDMRRLVEEFHAAVTARATLVRAALAAAGRDEDAKRVTTALSRFTPLDGLTGFREMMTELGNTPGLSRLSPALDLLVAYGPEIMAEGAPVAPLDPAKLAELAGDGADGKAVAERLRTCLMPADVEGVLGGPRKGRAVEDIAAVLQMERGIGLMFRTPARGF